MNILLILVIGAAAGFLATRMMDIETGVPQTIAIGVLGALIGGVVLRILIGLIGAAAGFVGAVLGSILLIWIYQTYFNDKS